MQIGDFVAFSPFILLYSLRVLLQSFIDILYIAHRQFLSERFRLQSYYKKVKCGKI